MYTRVLGMYGLRAISPRKKQTLAIAVPPTTVTQLKISAIVFALARQRCCCKRAQLITVARDRDSDGEDCYVLVVLFIYLYIYIYFFRPPNFRRP